MHKMQIIIDFMKKRCFYLCQSTTNEIKWRQFLIYAQASVNEVWTVTYQSGKSKEIYKRNDWRQYTSMPGSLRLRHSVTHYMTLTTATHSNRSEWLNTAVKVQNVFKYHYWIYAPISILSTMKIIMAHSILMLKYMKSNIIKILIHFR